MLLEITVFSQIIIDQPELLKRSLKFIGLVSRRKLKIRCLSKELSLPSTYMSAGEDKRLYQGFYFESQMQSILFFFYCNSRIKEPSRYLSALLWYH